jgi:hypothetical protein
MKGKNKQTKKNTHTQMTAVNTNSFMNGPAPVYDSNIVRNIQMKQPTIFLVCQKSKNHNVPVYEVLHDEKGRLCDPPITGYCLILDTGAAYQPSRRKNGILHDRSPFNMLDLKFAWGWESKRLSDTEAEFWFTMFPKQRFTVTFQQKCAKMYAIRGDHKYLLRSMYVEASEQFHLFDLSHNIKTLYFKGVDISVRPPKPVTIHWNE